MDLKLSQYDVAMLFGLIAFGRRYGDLQTSDWAAGLRDRLKNELESMEETVAILDDEDTMSEINQAQTEFDETQNNQ